MPRRTLHLPRPHCIRWHPHRDRHALPMAAGISASSRRRVGMVDAAALRQRRLSEFPQLPDLWLSGHLARSRPQADIASSLLHRWCIWKTQSSTSAAAQKLARPSVPRYATRAEHPRRLRSRLPDVRRSRNGRSRIRHHHPRLNRRYRAAGHYLHGASLPPPTSTLSIRA